MDCMRLLVQSRHSGGKYEVVGKLTGSEGPLPMTAVHRCKIFSVIVFSSQISIIRYGIESLQTKICTDEVLWTE